MLIMTIVVSKVFQLTGLQSCESPGSPGPMRREMHAQDPRTANQISLNKRIIYS